MFRKQLEIETFYSYAQITMTMHINSLTSATHKDMKNVGKNHEKQERFNNYKIIQPFSPYVHNFVILSILIN